MEKVSFRFSANVCGALFVYSWPFIRVFIVFPLLFAHHMQEVPHWAKLGSGVREPSGTVRCSWETCHF